MMFNFRRKIRFGVAAENRPAERRVAILPRQLRGLARHHRVMVEKGAGLGIGVTDAEYRSAGARIADKKEVYGADLVLRINAPRESELKLMKPGKFVMCMLHIRARPRLAGLLRKYRVNAIALEEIRDQFGERRVEAVHETGYIGMNTGFDLWGKDPARAVVKIMGYGHLAWGAIQAAARNFARVIVLNKRDINEMERHLPGTDLLVNALNWPYELRGRVFLVKRRMLKMLKPGAVIVDLVANPEGQSPVETCRPTSLDALAYKVDGVVHTCCWGWPGLDPENISRRYSIQIAPILARLARRGLADLPEYLCQACFRGMS